VDSLIPSSGLFAAHQAAIFLMASLPRLSHAALEAALSVEYRVPLAGTPPQPLGAVTFLAASASRKAAWSWASSASVLPVYLRAS
jgi:hypothetical protein